MIFVQRTYDLVHPTRSGEMLVVIDTPEVEADGTWRCDLRCEPAGGVEAFAPSWTMRMYGVDALQALLAALAVIEAHLESIGDDVGGQWHLDGTPGLGLAGP